MQARNPAEITILLERMRSGDPGAVDLRREQAAGDMLEPTALVHEAYLRMVVHQDQDWQNRAHFFGAAARVMRRISVDYARARNAQKRDDGNAVPLDEALAASPERSDRLLALDEALARLETI